MKRLSHFLIWLDSPIGKDLVANYVASVWLGALNLLLLPVYIGLLGTDQWGMVALCLATQGFAGLIDLGLSQIMPRDISRGLDDVSIRGRVFRIYSLMYVCLGLIAVCCGMAVAPWLLNSWFNGGRGVGEALHVSLSVALLQFFFQFANGANIAYWNGLQLQRIANVRTCIFVTCKHVFAMFAINFADASPLAYFLPFAFVSFVEFLLNRHAIKKSIEGYNVLKVGFPDFRRVWGSVYGVSAGVMIGMLVSQVDKVYLSGALTPAEFGAYAMLSTLGLAFMQLQYPVMLAIFPSVVRDRNLSSVRSGMLIMLGLCVLPCCLIAIEAKALLSLWVGQANMTQRGVWVFQALLMTVAINSIYHVIYQYIIAANDGRYLSLINMISLIAALGILMLGAGHFGMLAGGLSWLGVSVVQLVLGTAWWLRQRARIKMRHI